MNKTALKQRGRPKGFDNDVILEKAMNVFWARGYEGTSLAELTDVLGINKPSLYAAFGDKEELFRKALAKYLASQGSVFREALGAETSRLVATNFLLNAAKFLTDDSHPKGCMIAQGALNYGRDAELIHEEMTRQRKNYEEALRERFERAKNEKDLNADADATQLAKFVATLHQGMSVQATSGATREELEAVVDMALKNWPGI